MTILDALKQNKISISCGKKTLTCNCNGMFAITEYDEISVISQEIVYYEEDAVDELIKSKVCKIINGKYSWKLEVDKTITIITDTSTDYFDKHYSKLGYIVEFYREEENGKLVLEPNYRKE